MIEKNFLFGVPIFKSKVDPNTYDKESIINRILYNYKVSPYRNKWDSVSNLHHSHGDWENKDFEEFEKEKLLQIYSDIFLKTTNSLKLSKNESFNCYVEIVNYTCTSKNQYMREHNHLNSYFSGVHFLKYDRKFHDSTTFKNPSIFSEYINFLIPEKIIKGVEKEEIENSWLSQSFNLKVEEDDVIIFPSILNHFIKKQLTEKLRITIAFNVKIT
jgi:hypothetical protein